MDERLAERLERIRADGVRATVLAWVRQRWAGREDLARRLRESRDAAERERVSGGSGPSECEGK
jgi:hypothetical protein